MPPSRTTKRLGPDALAMKALVTATSLAVTLGGWAVLAIEQPGPPAAEAPIVDTIATQPPASAFELHIAPLPTLVAPPPPPPKIVIDSPPPTARAQPVARRPVIQAPAAAPAAAVAQPAPAPPAPPLRVVSAPPKPVARTRSSR